MLAPVACVWTRSLRDTARCARRTRAAARGGAAVPGVVLDFVTSWLRLFRLTRTVWVESDGAVVHGGACELVYYCPHALACELAAALVRRAGEHGTGAQVLEVVPTRWAELLAEP